MKRKQKIFYCKNIIIIVFANYTLVKYQQFMIADTVYNDLPQHGIQ